MGIAFDFAKSWKFVIINVERDAREDWIEWERDRLKKRLRIRFDKRSLMSVKGAMVEEKLRLFDKLLVIVLTHNTRLGHCVMGVYGNSNTIRMR